MSKTEKKPVTAKVKAPSSSFLQTHFYTLVILLFSAGLYINTLPNNYSLDDELVTQNHKLTSQGIKAIPTIFTSPYYSDEMGYSYDYRPLVLVTFAIEHQIFGDNPHVSHFINLLIYFLLCLALFRLLQTIFARSQLPLLPFIAVLLFIAHPLHTEAVASIKNRDEILSLLFSVLALHWALRAPLKGILTSSLLSVVFYTLALLTKPTAFTFALIIPLMLVAVNAQFAMAIGASMVLSLISLLFMSGYSTRLKLVFLFGVLASTVGATVLANIALLFAKIKKAFLSLVSFVWTLLKKALPYLLFIVAIAPVVVFFLTGLKHDWLLVITLTISAALFLFNKSLVPQIIALLVFEAVLMAIEPRLTPYVNTAPYVVNLVLLITLYWRVERPIQFLLAALYIVQTALATFLMATSNIAPALLVAAICMLPVFLPRKNYHKILLGIAATVGLSINVYDTVNGKGPDIEMLLMLLALAGYVFSVGKGWYAKFVGGFFVYLVSVVIVSDVIVYNKHQQLAKIEQEEYAKNNSLKKNVATIPVVDTAKILTPVIINVDTVAATPILLPTISPGVTDRPLDFVEAPVQSFSPLSVRLATGSVVSLRYIKSLLLPYPLYFYYGYSVISPASFADIEAICGAVLIVLMAILLLLSITHKRLVFAVSISFILIFLLSLSNVFFTIPGMMGDRYMLAPSIGLAILLAWAMLYVFKALSTTNLAILPPTAKYFLAVTLVCYSTITFTRNFQWYDKLTLMQHDIEGLNESAQAHNLLGHVLMAESMDPKNSISQRQMQLDAVSHFRKALDIYPKFFNVAFDLGRAYEQLNMPDSAIVAYQKALQLNNTYYQIHLNLSNLLINSGRPVEAVPLLETFIKGSPKDYTGYEKLSFVYFRLGQYAESVLVNKAAIKELPNEAAAYINIARVFKTMEQSDSAKAYLNKALTIAPGNSDALILLNSLK